MNKMNVFALSLMFICGFAAGAQYVRAEDVKPQNEKKMTENLVLRKDIHNLLWEMKKLETLYEYAKNLDIKSHGMTRILKDINLELEMAQRDAYVALGKEQFKQIKEEFNNQKKE